MYEHSTSKLYNIYLGDYSRSMITKNYIMFSVKLLRNIWLTGIMFFVLEKKPFADHNS